MTTSPRTVHVNLDGQSSILAHKRCDYVDAFRDACDYCLDAPIWYAAGSSKLLMRDDDLIATITTRVQRDKG